MDTVNSGRQSLNGLPKWDRLWNCCNCTPGYGWMPSKLHMACTNCQHEKCDNCGEEDAQERNGQVHLLSEDTVRNEALRKRKIHQTLVSLTDRAALSSAKCTNGGQTKAIPDEAEPDGLHEALAREYTPCSEVEPRDIVTVPFGEGAISEDNFFNSDPISQWGWGWGAGSNSPPYCAANDWAFISGHPPYSDFHSTTITDQISAHLPSAVYSSPREYLGLGKGTLSQETSPRRCRDIKACDSCLLDTAVLEKPLACVFYKNSPGQFSSCMQKSFKDISALGQHLKKCHGRDGAESLPPIPKVHIKNANWKWYWISSNLPVFKGHPPPRCPYPHSDQDMEAHTLHQFFRHLTEAQRAGVDIGYEVQSIVQCLSSSQEPLSDGQFMDTLHISSLAQHIHPGANSGMLSQRNWNGWDALHN